LLRGKDTGIKRRCRSKPENKDCNYTEWRKTQQFDDMIMDEINADIKRFKKGEK
jgi:hypothetical protein